jgi:F-type H+-transporting ATPase subunit delta
MSDKKIANRYAQAFMQEAVEKNSVKSIAESMEFILSVCESSKDLRNVLNNPIIHTMQKQNALLKIFKSCDPLISNFITLICSKNRESLIPLIAESYLELYRTINKIQKVNIQSASPLSDTDQVSIQKYVQGLTGAASIELHTTINKELIGGMVIKFGDNLLDTSITAKLRKLKKELNIA